MPSTNAPFESIDHYPHVHNVSIGGHMH